MKKIVVLSLIIFLFVCTNSFALDRGLEASQFRPVSDNGSYFGVWDSQNLYGREWRVGTFATYEYRPFQLTRNGNRQRQIIDNTVIQHLSGAYGIFDKWLSVGFDLPVGWWVDYRNPNVAGATATNDFALGDLRINLKSQLYGSHCKKFGLAIIPFIDIPTGYGSEFFGNGTINGGALLAFDYKPWHRFSLSFNTGIMGRSTYNFRDIERKAQLLWSLGAKYKISHKWALNTEILSQTRLTGIYSEEVESPTEVLAGLKYKIGHTGLTASLGGGMGITYGSLSPQYRVFSGITYTPLKRNIHKLKQVINTQVNFDSGSAVIKEEEAGKLATIKKWIKKTYGLPIMISGHTDIESDEAYNQALSEKRAQEIKTYLVANHIRAKRLSTEGFGETKPIATNDTEAGRTKNRRVSFEMVECK